MTKNVDKRTIHDTTKIYPDQVRVLSFKVAFDVTLGAKPRTEKKSWLFPKLIQERNQKRAAQHTKTTILDIALCNDFEHFCTFTFNPKKVKSRYEIGLLKVIMSRWLESQRKKHGRFDYLIVPEYHKDGAIHFHALFARYNGPLSDSGKKTAHGHAIMNFAGFRYGFSTAVPIAQTDDDRAKVAHYLSKYITKDMPTFPGQKKFWASKGLTRPERLVNHRFNNPTDEIYCAT